MRKSGFTIIEVLITIVLIGLVMTIGTNIILFGMKSQEVTSDEFDLQANVRLVTLNVNNAVRNASGVFVLSKSYPDGSIPLTSYFTEGWNYMMMNADQTALVEWYWDGTQHLERTIVDAIPGVTFNVEYTKHEAPDVNRLLEYTLNINTGGSTQQIKTELESVNALQVMDRSYGLTANTLAYREDPRLTDVAVAQAAVSFVMDRSGSMSTNDMPGSKTRLSVLKTEAIKMITGMADNDNIYLSVSPFSYNANNTAGDNRNLMLQIKPNLQTFIGTTGVVNSLTASGNTNTGDGMRRGYKSIEAFNNLTSNIDKTTKNFMIILVDGETNRASLYENITSSKTYYDNPAPHQVTISGNLYNFESWNSSNDRFLYRRVSGSGTYTSYDDPLPHSTTINGRTYTFSNWNYHWWYGYRFNYTYSGVTGPVFVNSDQNINTVFDTGSGSFENNTLYNDGAVPDDDLEATGYVNYMGGIIRSYKNTRLDGIKTYVIGFSSDATPTGVANIAKAVGATEGTESAGTNSDGVACKYYVADTDAALAAVLEEIKFQISEALWHIGGPN